MDDTNAFWLDDDTTAAKPTTERVQPADPLVDLDAERATLGAITLDVTVLADVLAIARPEDFADPRHTVILDALVAIDGKPDAVDRGAVNLVTLGRHLRAIGRFNTVGGSQYVAELSECVPSSSHARESARLVAELAARRRVRESALVTSKHAADLRRPIDAVADAGSTALLGAAKGGRPVSSLCPLGTSLQRVAERVGEVETRGCPLPWPSIDRAIRGLRGGRVHYVAGLTSMGKSSLARNMAVSLAAPAAWYASGPDEPTDPRADRVPVPFLFFAMEMPTDENSTQVIASVLGCAGSDIENGTLQSAGVSHDAYIRARGVLDAAPLYFDAETDHATQQIALARQFVRSRKGKPVSATDPRLVEQVVIVLDYLQLSDPEGLVPEKNPTRERMVGAMSRAWKRFAMKEDVPVVILSQLNREASDGKCPVLKDLRESGSLEQDADVVMFLWGEQPDAQAATQTVNATLAKIRGGPRNVMVPLTFHRKPTRFFEIDPAAERPSSVYPIRGGRNEEHDPGFTYDPEGTNDAE